MNLNLPINELKRELAAGKDLSAVMKYFFDQFVDKPGFMEGGHPAQVPKDLERCIFSAVALMRGKTKLRVEWRLFEVPLLQLIHGMATINGEFGMIVWAPDITTGILCLSSNPMSAKKEYARLSVTSVNTPV